MKLSYQLLIAAFIFSFAGDLVWSANHYNSKYQDEKQRADTAEQQANSATAITDNVLHTVSVINTISEANQNAKQKVALESQRAESDIKVAVAGDDCTNRPVPASAAKRLHDYANGLRSGATSTTSGNPDG